MCYDIGIEKCYKVICFTCFTKINNKYERNKTFVESGVNRT